MTNTEINELLKEITSYFKKNRGPRVGKPDAEYTKKVLDTYSKEGRLNALDRLNQMDDDIRADAEEEKRKRRRRK